MNGSPERIVKLLNENQGVIAVISILGGVIFWVWRNFRKKSKSIPGKIQRQSVIVLGSNNYIEGQAMNSVIERGRSGKLVQKTQPKARVICSLLRRKMPEIDWCLEFEFLGDPFIIQEIDLKKIIDKSSLTNKGYEMTNVQLIELLKSFFAFDPNSIQLSLNEDLYSRIRKELATRSLAVEIVTRDKVSLAIPFHHLDQEDFGVANNTLSFSVIETL